MKTTPGETELRIDYHLPVLENMQYVFFPNGDQPLPTKAADRRQLLYRKDIAVPCVSSYNKKTNCGITIFSPLEIDKPWLAFIVDRSNIVVSNRRLRLSSMNRVNTAITIVTHGGDWRPGLAYLLANYPDHFYPKSKHVIEGEGWYYLADAFDDDHQIQEASAAHTSWTEIHGHFPFYGLYVPEVKEWSIIFDSDNYDLIDWDKGLGRKKNNVTRMRQAIDKWHKQGIQVYLYFQCFEAWYRYALQYFQQSIAKDKYGNPLPGWKYTFLMNPDPEYEWGNHIVNQIAELLRVYQNVDGIFYDRMDYWHYDFDHEDNITFVDNRSAYTLALAQEKINGKIFDLLHQNGKGIWGNGPASIEVCKNLDGVMAERYKTNLFRLQYLTLVRPFIFLAYDREPRDTEEKLKNALLCGAFPSITMGTGFCKKLDEKYRPLFDLIRNRKWVLHEDPISIPENLLGNIYQTPGGDYVVILIDPNESQLSATNISYNVEIAVRVPNIEQINYAYLHSADWSGIRSLSIDKHNNAIYITLPQHTTASVVVLSQKQR
ncbi:MAG: hypothetical protein JSV98_05245 [candidate division WOR-3 bacterium]|nr:MAG: hypothetical protein JSV98_05245 [candidate division WOR-3 bacterium]